MTKHPISFEVYRNPKQPQPLHHDVRYRQWLEHAERTSQRRAFRQRLCDFLLGAAFAVLSLLILMAL